MAKKDRWLFATNTENLKNIIAQGLITEPSGFSKYYSDCLELSPGKVMIFKDIIPEQILEKSVSEDSTLDKCILELSFDNISGSVEYFPEHVDNKVSKETESNESDGDLFKEAGKNDSESNEDIQIDNVTNIEDIKNSPQVIYVELPLPLSSIKTIIFSSKVLKDKFISEITPIPNIPLNDLTFKIEAKLFNSFSPVSIENIKLQPIKEIDYSLVYAYGGLLTMLFYYAKNGELSNKLFHSMSNLERIEEKTDENIEWICNYYKLDENNENVLSLYRELLDVVKNSKNIKDEIIQTLEMYTETKYKKRTKELSEILMEFVQNPQKTPSEYFYGAKKPLEKWLLMLFFKDSSEELINYPTMSKVIDFTEVEYILFAMIFGIRDKFINLPRGLRGFQGLQNYISLKMASYAHKLRNSSIKFSIKKQDVPLTLTDMFEKKDFKILFSKQHKIDCLSSTLKLPKGSRTEHNKDSVVYYSGDLHDYVELNINDKEFYKPMLKKIVSKEDYKKYLTQYKKF